MCTGAISIVAALSFLILPQPQLPLEGGEESGIKVSGLSAGDLGNKEGYDTKSVLEVERASTSETANKTPQDITSRRASVSTVFGKPPALEAYT